MPLLTTYYRQHWWWYIMLSAAVQTDFFLSLSLIWAPSMLSWLCVEVDAPDFLVCVDNIEDKECPLYIHVRDLEVGFWTENCKRIGATRRRSKVGDKTRASRYDGARNCNKRSFFSFLFFFRECLPIDMHTRKSGTQVISSRHPRPCCCWTCSTGPWSATHSLRTGRHPDLGRENSIFYI